MSRFVFILALLATMLSGALALAQDSAATDAAAADAAAADQQADRESAAEAAATADSVTAAEGAATGVLGQDEFIARLTDPDLTSEELDFLLLPLTADQIASIAEKWLLIVQGQTAAVVTEQLAIREAEGLGDSVSRDRLIALTDERNRGFENFSSVVDSLALKGGDEALVTQYRAFRNAIIVEETAAADWKTLVSRAADWAVDVDGGIALLIRVAVVVASFIGLMLAARFVRGIARHWIARVPNLSRLLQAFLAMVIYWLTIAIGLMIVLGALGVDITPLFAIVGGASFIIAFAMQDTLGNLAAGLMIMINRPFDEGDYVNVGGVGGTVKSVSVVSTTVNTPDNQVIVIPNSRVWGDIITNVTASDTRRIDLVFGIGYSDSIEKAQSVLEAVVSAHPSVLSDPAPVIRVNTLGASSVDFVCRPWVRIEDYWSTYWDLTRQVKEAFDANGISIPYPQTDMHLHVATPAAAATPLVAAAVPAPAQKTVGGFAKNDDGSEDKGEEGDGEDGGR